MSSDQEIARQALRFQQDAKEWRMPDLPGYSEWCQAKLDSGESEALIAHLDSTTVMLLPEDSKSGLGVSDFDEMLQELKDGVDEESAYRPNILRGRAPVVGTRDHAGLKPAGASPLTQRKFVTLAGWAFAAIPHATILLFVAYGLAARNALGHWPVAYKDNVPAYLGVLDSLASYLLLATFWSVAAGFVLSLSLFSAKGRELFASKAIVYWSGVVVAALLARWDPAGLFAWFID